MITHKPAGAPNSTGGQFATLDRTGRSAVVLEEVVAEHTNARGVRLTPAQSARRAALLPQARTGSGYSRRVSEGLGSVEHAHDREAAEMYLSEAEGRSMAESSERAADVRDGVDPDDPESGTSAWLVLRDGDDQTHLAAAEHPDTIGRHLQWIANQASNEHAVRAAVAHPNFPQVLVENFSRSSRMPVRAGAAASPHATQEMLDRLGSDPEPSVRIDAAGNTLAGTRTLDRLADDPDARVVAAVKVNASTHASTLARLAEREGASRVGLSISEELDRLHYSFNGD